MSVAVENNGFVKAITNLNVAVEFFSVETCSGDVEAGNSHITGGERGGLASDDVAKLSGGLEGVQVLDEEVLGLKLVNGEGHGHGDNKRHAFWDANDHEGDCGHHEVKKTLKGDGGYKLSRSEHNSEEPDDTEKNDRDDAKSVGVSTDDFSKNSELFLEGSLTFLNLEGILVTLKVFFDLFLLQGVFANSKDESFASSGHNNGVLEQDWVGVRDLILLNGLVGALLLNRLGAIGVGEELLLVDSHIHLFEEEAVSGDAVTLVDKDDVTDDEVGYVDGLGCAVLTTQYCHLFVHDLFAESQELLLFAPITEGLNCGREEHGKVDRDTLEPLAILEATTEDSHEEADGGEH